MQLLASPNAEEAVMIKSIRALVSIAALTLSLSVAAQQLAAPAPIKRTLPQRVDVPRSVNMEKHSRCAWRCDVIG
jgi:hypothetical protein